MTWQLVVEAQVLASSVNSLYARHIAVKSRKIFFGVGVRSYMVVAIVGLLYSAMYNRAIPSLPVGGSWLYILLEGTCIPIAWLFQYKLITYLGASNAVIATSVNTIGAALLGILFLNEPLTAIFIAGVVFIMASVYVALHIQPDISHHDTASFTTKLLLLLGAFAFFATGMFFEKRAITAIGVWHYSFYGWSMQFIVAAVIYWLFGRSERVHMTQRLAKKSLLLGLITSISGGLYIYALSKGSFSHTIVATSGKVAITLLLAAIFLKERNNMTHRIVALTLSMLGIALILF